MLRRNTSAGPSNVACFCALPPCACMCEPAVHRTLLPPRFLRRDKILYPPTCVVCVTAHISAPWLLRDPPTGEALERRFKGTEALRVRRVALDLTGSGALQRASSGFVFRCVQTRYLVSCLVSEDVSSTGQSLRRNHDENEVNTPMKSKLSPKKQRARQPRCLAPLKSNTRGSLSTEVHWSQSNQSNRPLEKKPIRFGASRCFVCLLIDNRDSSSEQAYLTCNPETAKSPVNSSKLKSTPIKRQLFQ